MVFNLSGPNGVSKRTHILELILTVGCNSDYNLKYNRIRSKADEAVKMEIEHIERETGTNYTWESSGILLDAILYWRAVDRKFDPSYTVNVIVFDKDGHQQFSERDQTMDKFKKIAKAMECTELREYPGDVTFRFLSLGAVLLESSCELWFVPFV